MFRSRRTSQKPGDELLANFRQQFPEVAAATSTTSSASPPAASAAPVENPVAREPSQERSHDPFRDQDPTPRANNNEQWRFTPSLLDSNSFSFTNYHGHHSYYGLPTPGASNTLYHPQAGDLHTPTLGLGMPLGTPLSMPNSEAGINSGTAISGPGIVDLSAFQTLPPDQFHQFNPFIHAAPPDASFAPSTFVHQDTGYETMDHDGSPMDSDHSEGRMVVMDNAFQVAPPLVGFQPGRQPGGMQMSMPPLPASAEKFRYHTTLNAPTAMIKNADEIPVTYLNKGQAYSLSVVDTNAPGPIVPGTQYRTYVRISFEDEQQRLKPGVCWSLWKEGRGTNEAHQRGGKLQAVEFAEARESSSEDDKQTKVELEHSSFDGFSVIWTPGINANPEVNIAVRFNFLSTDFSHSKGVKGIPVRLCAKTSLHSTDVNQPAADAKPEICFCKVKLFRDHGAERKLSNDVAHVKKTIDKLKQQIAQAESGMKDFGKRKRGTGGQKTDRPGKVQKQHKRSWSMSSASSGGGTKPHAEDDMHAKLQILQDMFTSTRPASILYLRGEDLDDPDLHPVSLAGESKLGKLDTTRVGPAWQARSGQSSVTNSSMVSPSPSSVSLTSQGQWGESDMGRKISDKPHKINKTDDDGNLSGWIEALGVDTAYRPPREKVAKPVACFYIKRQTPTDPGKREYHKAVYLTSRTIQDLNARIAAKWDLDATQILRTVHVMQQGFEVEMDDDVVEELKEGQDMALEVVQLGDSRSQPKREWDMAVDSNNGSSSQAAAQSGYEIRLIF